MAAGRSRWRWIAIGGTTAAVLIAGLSALALAAPTGFAISQSVTHVAPHLSWGEDGTATGYDVERGSGACASATFVPVAGGTGLAASPFDDTTLIADGTYCYHVVGHYSGAADVTSTGAPVLYDATPPLVQITSPIANSSVSGVVSITASASDGGSGLASLAVSIDGVAVYPVVHASPTTVTWDTTALGVNGSSYDVRAVAFDNAGNSSTALAHVTIDNTPPPLPIVSATSPVAGSPTLSWPSNPGETYTISRNGTSLGVVPPQPWTDPAALAPGTYHYVVTAIDAAGNASSSAATQVVVILPSATAPRAIAAASPTNTTPHVTWQTPVTFAVTGWTIFRDGAQLAQLDPAVGSFDDTTATQGPHTYSVQALSSGVPGDMSSSVSVTYDTVAPVLAAASASANPNGSVSVIWPVATDPSPGAGIAGYVVRRTPGTTGPSDPTSGTAVCSLRPPDTGCVDSSAKDDTLYGYSVFAIDAAGNVARRMASAKASDTQPPDAVAGLKVLTFDRTYARLSWNVPALEGADADISGYRVLKLRPGAKAPLNPQDGTIVCRNGDPQNHICDALGLTAGKSVTFAVYAYDDVLNYSAPAMVSMVPHAVDHIPPHRPTKVTLTHAGLVYTLRWVSPRDLDLSKFRVTLLPRKPSPRPAVGKAVVTGRVLHANFTLAAGQKVYVNLFALDVSGNFSRVTKYVAVPAIATRSRHKVVKRHTGKTTTAKKTVAKKKAKPSKPVAVTVEKA
jgi:hypothetical protein